MGLASRLLIMVVENRLSEKEAEAILAHRTQLWTGQEKNGQMLLAFTKSEEDDKPIPQIQS